MHRFRWVICSQKIKSITWPEAPKPALQSGGGNTPHYYIRTVLYRNRAVKIFPIFSRLKYKLVNLIGSFFSSTNQIAWWWTYWKICSRVNVISTNQIAVWRYLKKESCIHVPPPRFLTPTCIVLSARGRRSCLCFQVQLKVAVWIDCLFVVVVVCLFSFYSITLVV